jgi:hypothetical protein
VSASANTSQIRVHGATEGFGRKNLVDTANDFVMHFGASSERGALSRLEDPVGQCCAVVPNGCRT